MKRIKTFLIAILATTLMAAFVYAGDTTADKKDEAKEVEKAEIQWVRYDKGLATAKEEGKPILIDFTTSWCGWCKKMEREAFSDERIIKMLNDEFVPVRVDGDSKEQLDIEGYIITEKALTSQEFGVRGYPMFWFLESDGTRIGPLRGYQQTEPFFKALTFVRDKKYETASDEKTDGKTTDESAKNN